MNRLNFNFMSSETLRISTYVVGIALTLAATSYVIHELYHGEVWGDPVVREPGFLACMLAGTLLYTINGFILALSWSRILTFLNVTNLNALARISIYGRTQIAKYVPGNIFHLVGRHALIKKAGATHTQAAISTGLEFGCILAAALIISAIGLLWIDLPLDRYIPDLGTTRIIGIIAVLAIAVGLAWNRKKILRWIDMPDRSLRSTTVPLLGITLLYMLFFLVSGAAFLMLLWGQSVELSLQHIPTILTALAMSWAVGFITPGAPAGIGVREAGLILLLSPMLGEETSTLTAVAFRIVTLLGELFLLGICLLPSLNQPASTIEPTP